MRSITTTTGADIALDGDLLAIIETLFQEVTARRELDRSYEDMIREIRHLIGQMTEKERQDYRPEASSTTRCSSRTNASPPTCRSWPREEGGQSGRSAG
jgi:hypothetical protein